MQFLGITLLSCFLISGNAWQTDFEKAKQSAQTEHKLILLNFSGSDWCGPCIRMHKEIFDNNNFIQYADGHLILVNADFPRLKKNELSKDQQVKNDQLADVYNRNGIFPLTLLLTPGGKILRKWEGLPQISADEFIKQVKSLVDANN